MTLGPSLSGNKGIWLDLWGNSSSVAALGPIQAKKLAKNLRTVANWVEKEGVNYLKHNG